jgi:hypothetical protein
MVKLYFHVFTLPLTNHLPKSCAAPIPDGESETYQRIHTELVSRGCRTFRFARVPGPYYDKPLDFRAQRVGAASVEHMCKTMVMENTRAPKDVVDCSEPKLSKYYMVLVQYCANIDAEKLKGFIVQVQLLTVVRTNGWLCLP